MKRPYNTFSPLRHEAGIQSHILEYIIMVQDIHTHNFFIFAVVIWQLKAYHFLNSPNLQRNPIDTYSEHMENPFFKKGNVGLCFCTGTHI